MLRVLFQILNLRNRKTDPIRFINASISVRNVTVLLGKLVARMETLINSLTFNYLENFEIYLMRG